MRGMTATTVTLGRALVAAGVAASLLVAALVVCPDGRGLLGGVLAGVGSVAMLVRR